MDDHALQLLEFDRVAASIADHAASPAGRRRLVAWRPLADAAERRAENARLAEAIRRSGEPGAWVHTGRGDLEALLGRAGDPAEVLDGPALRELADSLEAARRTRDAWAPADVRERHARLAARVDELPRLDDLLRRLLEALDDDGAVRDDASPVLKRARAGLREGERELERRLEKWARGFGEGTYVTRHGDRFVALVPAAGFPRKLGIVHDVSATGHSLFVEPFESTEANNRLMEQRAVAFEEERRILRELESAVHAAREPLHALADVLAHLDTLAARARWARERAAIALDPDGDALELRAARHPLLLDALGAGRVVPLDLRLAGEARVLLVSGPNMGGKSVVLKLTGLACALAHAALPVPAAEGSRVPPLEKVHVDLGDEQSITQGLSTFAAHLKTLGAMARDAGPGTLVLCDELGAGTDPDEGAALGQALVEHFVDRGAWGVLTTHLGSLKRAAGGMRGVTNAAMEFDADGGGPRYRLSLGLPGASRALAMAERLGFEPAIVERAKAITPDTTRAVENLLLDLERTRDAMEAERAAAAAAEARAQEAERGLRAAEAAARDSLQNVRARLTAESEALLARSRELWQTVSREAKRAEKSRESAGALREQLAAAEGQLDALGAATERARAEFGVAPEAAAPLALVPGAKVHVRDLDVDAEIVSGPDAEGRVQLRRGGWTIQSHVDRLVAAAAGADAGRERPARAAGASWSVGDEAAPVEIDLRGLDSDGAVREIDRGLDRALLAGLGEVRIIHGLGTGVLKKVVARHLQHHPQVASSRMGELGEGGRGVTVARLR